MKVKKNIDVIIDMYDKEETKEGKEKVIQQKMDTDFDKIKFNATKNKEFKNIF